MTQFTQTKFTNLALAKPLKKGLEACGFEYCTPIQEATFPITLLGGDVAGQAQTGTGKTAAFLVSMLQYMLSHAPHPQRRPNQPCALILAPTRELAIQIHKDALAITQHLDFRLSLAYGGTGYQSQREQIEAGVEILIGTPGRVIDYLKQRVFDFQALQVLVLDEADRMFDLGFLRDIRYLLRRMPDPRQRLGMLYSATLSYRATELAYEHMNNPKIIKIETEKVTADKVQQVIYHTANEEKIPLLIGLLQQIDLRRGIIFVNTKRVAEQVGRYLEANGYKNAVLSGDVPQRIRQRLLQAFQNNRLPLLVATDVAARGLHIADVTHVFNFDLPQDAEDYVHRIGRTARLGASGEAISFACEHYAFSLPAIEEYIGIKITVEPVSSQLLGEITQPTRAKRPRPRRPQDKNGFSQKTQGGGHHSRSSGPPRSS